MIPAGDFVVGSGYGSLLPVHSFTLGETSRARGGTTIGVAASGLDVIDWTGRIDAGDFKITGAGPELTVVAVPGALSATFAFDRNMNPAVAWNTSSGAKLYWYDSAAEAYATTDYPDAVRAMVIHDDVRDIAEARSDVLLVYQRASGLYVRQQRDRYLVERTIREYEFGALARCGMGNAYRLLIEMG